SVPAGVYPPDGFPVPLWMQGKGYSPYRVVVGVKSPVPLRTEGAAVLPGVDNSNVLGNPDPAVVRRTTTDADFQSPARTVGGGQQGAAQAPAPTATLPPPHVPAHGPATDDLPQGFLLLAPPEDTSPAFAAADPFAGPNLGQVPPATPLARTATLEYTRFFP